MPMLSSAGGSVEPLGGIVCAVAGFAALGCLLGRCVTSGVGRLIHSMEAAWGVGPRGSRVPSIAARRGFEIASVGVAILVFVWESLIGGLDPIAAGDPSWMATWPRAVAHCVLFAFMSAAFWCDAEYRVIPDAITVPGAILGLVCVTGRPDLLLPVTCETAREFAAPALSPDVLGALGPLRCTAASGWLGPAPSAGGLAATAAAFAAWWLVCTAPAAARTAIRDPRAWLLPAGLLAATILWLVGGTSPQARLHFRAWEASLFGAAVSGGVVLLIRAGASRALGREAMGLGDVTLMAMVGAWCGWQHGVLAFFLAAFIGLAQGVMTFLRHRDNELPYGPSLCLASAGVVLVWRPAWDRVGVHFEEPLLLFAMLAGVIGMTAASLAVWARIRR